MPEIGQSVQYIGRFMQNIGNFSLILIIDAGNTVKLTRYESLKQP